MEFKPSNAAAVTKKLRDPSLHIGQIDVHPHDRPVSIDWDLQPGDTLAEAEFGKVMKTMRTLTSFLDGSCRSKRLLQRSWRPRRGRRLRVECWVETGRLGWFQSERWKVPWTLLPDKVESQFVRLSGFK